MTAPTLRLGIDFDNTIICYDAVFHAEARNRGLIPPELPTSKESIRDYLRARGQEKLWTELQGYVYGRAIVDAKPFPGVREFLSTLKAAGAALFLISHKTRYPYLGPTYDLHAAAWRWLDDQGFLADSLAPQHVFFELTKDKKLSRISKLGCTHFIDDLPEFLAETDFPADVQRILFDPGRRFSGSQPFWTASSFLEIAALLTRDWPLSKRPNCGYDQTMA